MVLFGAIVYSEAFSETHAAIDLSNLNPGSYIVRVIEDVVRKVVKQ